MSLLRHFIEPPLTDHQHAGQVEKALPLAALEAKDRAAFAVQVAVPLAVFVIGKMLEGIVMQALEPIQMLLPSGQLVRQQKGVDGMEERDGEVRGRVKDHGVGIAAEDLTRIWERFYRADSSRTETSHSGLGLSMVRWIAHAHGGDVSVASEAGKGSEFAFYFPAREENEKN